MPSKLRSVVIFGVPVLLGAINLTHPRMASPVYDKILHHMPWWLELHLINLVLFPLFGLAAYLVVKDQRGVAAAISKLAIAIYIPVYAAFDALAGVGTGIVVSSSRNGDTSNLAAASSLADVIFNGPVTYALGAAGSIAWIVGIFAAAVAFTVPERRKLVGIVAIILFVVGGWARGNVFLKADGVTITTTWWLITIAMAAVMFAVGRPRIPATLLMLAGGLFGAYHTPPTGPLGALCFMGAAISLEFAARNQDKIKFKAASV